MAEAKHNIIILSKLQTPQIKARALLRKRLINILTKNQSKKLLIICAGVGYGKTTLLSQFLAQKKLRNIYYHLEKSDSEPAVFFSYLISGIRKYYPDFGAKTEGLAHFFNYPQSYLELICGTFINELFATVTDDLYLILEDYHAIYPAELIDKIVLYLIDHIPPNIHFIITSRITLPFSISHLRGRDEICELGSHDLRFTRDEIHDLFVHVHNITLKNTELEWIDTHSEGWPISLRLMLQTTDYDDARNPTQYFRKILGSYYQSQSNLFNYFAQEIYNQESRDIKRFLLDCSIFEWLSPELINRVTNRSNSEVVLDELTNRNAFLLRIHSVGYRFHHLFRDFLRRKITDLQREKKLCLKAGEYFESNHNYEEAIKYYLRASAFVRVSVILERYGSVLIARGRSSIICTYIEKIPVAERRKRPLLLMNYVQALMLSGRGEEARANCLLVVKMLSRKTKMRRQYGDAMYRLGGIYLNEGNFRTAIKWFKKAFGISPASSYLLRSSILNSIGSVFTALGGRYSFEAIKYFKDSAKIAQRHNLRALEASILNNWAMVEFQNGDLLAAYSKLSRMVNILKENFSPGCGAGFYNAANVSLSLGNLKEAQQSLESGLKISSNYNDLWSLARIWEGFALLSRTNGDLEKAEQFINKAYEIYEKLGMIRLIISSLNEKSRIYLDQNKISDAEVILSKAWVLKDNRFDLESIPLYLTEARLKIKQNKYQDAENCLNQAIEFAGKFKHPIYEFMLNIELSNVCHHQNNNDRALATLCLAVDLSQKHGFDYLFAQELKNNSWMLLMLKNEAVKQRYILGLIKKFSIAFHWVELKMYGIPRISIDGIEITESVWPTKKAKKLLFYMLLNRHRKVSQDNLVETLWHDSSRTSGRNSLRKAVQHIRAILSKNHSLKDDFIVSGMGFYQIAQGVLVQVDCEEIEAIYRSLKDGRLPVVEQIAACKKIASIAEGTFATDWYDNWVEELRTYFQGIYEDALMQLTNWYINHRQLRQSLIYLKNLINTDYYNEAYHRLFMETLVKMGKNREAIRHYESFEKKLQRELGCKPQSETNEVYKKL